jgi:hypothetical protein
VPRARGVRRTETITDAIYGAGYNSSGRFYDTTSDVLGMTPTAFRAGGAGTATRFAVGRCWLGSILVAATEKGVCAILLGEDAKALVRDFQDTFPKARLIGGDAAFEALIAKVVGFVEAPARSRSAARRARHRLRAGRVAGAAHNPSRFDGDLRRDRRSHRPAGCRTRGGASVRVEPACGRDPVPSCRP